MKANTALTLTEFLPCFQDTLSFRFNFNYSGAVSPIVMRITVINHNLFSAQVQDFIVDVMKVHISGAAQHCPFSNMTFKGMLPKLEEMQQHVTDT